MSMLLNYVKSFVRKEEGQDLLEYALLVALIALIAIGAVGAGRQQRLGRSSRTSPASSRRRRKFDALKGVGGRRRSPFSFGRDPVGLCLRSTNPCRRRIASVETHRQRRLRRHDDGQDLLEYGVAHGADRGVRDRRGGDAGQHHQHGLLAVHCHQFLVPSFAVLAAGVLAATRRRSAHAAHSERADGLDGGHRGWPGGRRGRAGCRSGAAPLGFVMGFALMLPGHLLGATGAGDVKLMAAIGALVGPVLMVKAFLFTAIAGGVLAVVGRAAAAAAVATLAGPRAWSRTPSDAPGEIRGRRRGAAVSPTGRRSPSAACIAAVWWASRGKSDERRGVGDAGSEPDGHRWVTCAQGC